MDIGFIRVCDETQTSELAGLAREIWFEHFPGIISTEQVSYMVEKYQSEEAITRQIADDGYEYYFVSGEHGILGYLAIKPEPGKLLLSKLYLKREHRGKGYFNGMLAFAERTAKEKGLTTLYLTVNRHNDRAITVYRKKGFEVIKETVTDIGGSFVMDDFVMEKVL